MVMREGGGQMGPAGPAEGMPLPQLPQVLSHKGERSMLSDCLLCQDKLEVGIFV